MAAATTTVPTTTTAPTARYGCDNRQMPTITGTAAAPAEATAQRLSVSLNRTFRVSSAW
jgi:hypothetical protein